MALTKRQDVHPAVVELVVVLAKLVEPALNCGMEDRVLGVIELALPSGTKRLQRGNDAVDRRCSLRREQLMITVRILQVISVRRHTGNVGVYIPQECLSRAVRGVSPSLRA